MMMCLFRKPGRWIFLDWRGYLVSIGAVGLATLIKYFARPDIITAPNSLPYIVAIVITAVHFGFGPAIFASFISVIIYDFFFAEPLNNFTLVGTQQITVLITFLLVGVIVSYLASSLRNRTEEAIRESTLRKQHEEELLKYRDHLEDLIKQRTAALEGTNLILKVEVAERKKAEESLARAKDDLETKVSERTRALTESEDKYRLLVENANEAVVVFQDNREKFINHKAIETLGYSAEELASTPISDFIHPDDRNLVVDRYLKRLQGTAVPSSYEFRMIHKSGRTLWVNINAVLIDWKGRPAVLALMTDITERKNLEQALKKYAERITRVQEEERKRIAYELHDDTAQYLSILKLQLDSLISSGKIRDPEVLRKLQFLEKDAGRAVDDVRRYSHELRPGVLEHLGLQAALEQIADDINKLQQIEVKVVVEGEEPVLSEEVKLGFFRIAQEALNNARRHAKASLVTLNLKYGRDRIWMTVIDNGIGFDIQEAKERTGLKGSLGLMSMQERAKLIGADLKIESVIDQGTAVKVEVTL